ncbi:MAG: hypothetical protein HY816_08145 [Candidatus Wallbacteria bacterium]|nr:hypothetical protein [Candidatus Wallbacteria bacterium]
MKARLSARRPKAGVAVTGMLLFLLLPARAPGAEPALPSLEPCAVASGIRFQLSAPLARRVSIAGSFNGWSSGRHLLSDPEGDGVWSIDLPLPAGEHEYLMLIDGQSQSVSGRVGGRAPLAFQTHQPLDMRMRWLVAVNVCRVLPGGGLSREPLEPATFALLNASRTLFSDGDDVYEVPVRQALDRLARALASAPGSAALLRMRDHLEARFLLERRALEARRKRLEGDLESVVLPLLKSPFLTVAERQAVREAVRGARRPAPHRRPFETLAAMAERDHWRAEVPGHLARWRRSPADAAMAARLRTVLGRAFDSTDPKGVEAWDRTLAEVIHGGRLSGLDAKLEVLVRASRALALAGEGTSRNEALEGLLDALLRSGLPAAAVALELDLVPAQRPIEGALWMLERLAGQPDLRRDYLQRALTKTPALRDQPVVEQLLRQDRVKARDPLIYSRLTARLASVAMVGHQEDTFYDLLGERLRADGTELELVEGFESFLLTMDRLEENFPGLLANPWRRTLLERLEPLTRVAPANPGLVTLAARRMLEAARSADAAALLAPLVRRHPGEAEAALLLARALDASGEGQAALEALRRCWRARPGSQAVARGLAERLSRAGRRDELRAFLEQRFAQPGLGASAVAAAVTAFGDPSVLGAFLDGLRVEGPVVGEAVLRAQVRSAIRLGRHQDAARRLTAWEARAGARAASAWRYGALAASVLGGAGAEGLAEAWMGRALELGPRRRWLLDCLDGPSESLARRVAKAGSAGEAPAPFLLALARLDARAGNAGAAAAHLRALLPYALVPEDEIAFRAGLVLCELRAARPLAAFAELGRLLLAGRQAMLYLAAALLLPFAVALGLAAGARAAGQEISPKG